MKNHLKLYQELLGNGDNLGISIRYKIQKKPEGLPKAFIIGEKFINNEPVCLNLGDHIFFGDDVPLTWFASTLFGLCALMLL